MKERVCKTLVNNKVAIILAVALCLSLLLNAHLDLSYAKYHRLFVIGKGKDIHSVVTVIENMSQSLTKVTSQQQQISPLQKGELKGEMIAFQEDMSTLVGYYYAISGGNPTIIQKYDAVQTYENTYLSFIYKISGKDKLSNQDLHTLKTWKDIVDQQFQVTMTFKDQENNWMGFLDQLNKATKQGEKG